ncbi:uncharacterized protein LOC121050169 isoform X2 [Rosa chinensis]|nr:uncharacterized protein LOC121050169 isoform X2 [Rosa chinensis]
MISYRFNFCFRLLFSRRVGRKGLGSIAASPATTRKTSRASRMRLGRLHLGLRSSNRISIAMEAFVLISSKSNGVQPLLSLRGGGWEVNDEGEKSRGCGRGRGRRGRSGGSGKDRVDALGILSLSEGIIRVFQPLGRKWGTFDMCKPRPLNNEHMLHLFWQGQIIGVHAAMDLFKVDRTYLMRNLV